jgi:GH15 family glucan-1,4-alpha-glucosidase
MATGQETEAGKLDRLNEQLSRHMALLRECEVDTERYGRLLLASPPETRYPYLYPRDSASAAQLFRRLAGSRRGYAAADEAYRTLESMARFYCDVAAPDGNWGQRYGLDGKDRSIYVQEDNVAHGISILANYLLTAHRLERQVADRRRFLEVIERALHHAQSDFFHRDLNLFESTTAIHESALESGYTIWVNFSFLYAFSLADEVARRFDPDAKIICREHLAFRRHLLHSVAELFMSGDRYIRRIDPHGQMDLRPDFTLLSPFYFGFLHYEKELARSVRFIEKQLWDPELGMIMRYLPFDRDPAVHVHAGNGPWLQYTAILAQYHFWSGNTKRGDELLAMMDRYAGDDSELPEHLSTCSRFEQFLEKEWKTGVDFAKEFDRNILLPGLDFERILEEANNMARSYRQTGEFCRPDPEAAGGGHIRFATPLAWSHVEYMRALLVRSGDWWKMKETDARD